jgi:hypothetical protein
MGYFATRAAALGAAPAEVVTACFYNFAPTLVARALPDAWTYTTPERAVAARLDAFDAAITRLLGEHTGGPEIAEAAELTSRLVGLCDPAGRPLHAGHAALAVPTAPHLMLFWAAAALREFRGDGHNIALAAAGVDGCEAHVLMVALGLVPPDHRRYRGWTEQEWAAARGRLTERGWLDEAGAITEAGRAARERIERMTDRLAAPPLHHLGSSGCDRLSTLLTPLAARVVTNGGIPFPNGMGVPPVPELAAAP